MDRLVVAWYAWLSGLTQGFVVGVQDWSRGLEIPGLVVIVLGVVAAASPCQLTTNLGALAYASRQARGARPFTLALAYVAGKVSVYTVVGALVVIAGFRLEAASIPVIVVARKLIGPLMILVGLSLLGLVRLGTAFGSRVALGLRERLQPRRATGAYLLGVAFSFAFCPTLFWLFFGLTLPLALGSAAGWAFPGLFAVGASLPLLLIAAALAGGLATVDRLSGTIGRVERPLRRGAGVVLVLAGLHDTLVYWLL
jgi:cytochrome c-type biogenesis protein